MRLATLAGSIVVLVLVSGCEEDSVGLGDETFSATLTGGGEVPAVTTAASGDVDFAHDVSEAELEFSLSVDDMTDITAAHIHLGEPGENGPVVAFLFDPAAPITVNALTIISSGEITAGDVNTAQGFDGTFASLMEEIRAGRAYVNVHTVANPDGEIRGQIM